MNNNNTSITYEAVREEANKIKSNATTMKNILDDFNMTMTQVITPDTFEGRASESFYDSYLSLRSKFDSYTRLVEQFSNMILSAADATERTEKGIAADAENLPH